MVTQPAGMKLKLDVQQGIDEASRATSADPKRARDTLQSDGFRGGWARTWLKDDEDVQVLVFELGDAFRAADLATFQLKELSKGRGVVGFPLVGVPRGTAYSFSGVTRAGSKQVFCQGGWFVVNRFALNVTDCAGAPRYPNLVQEVAGREYVLAAHATGTPVESASP